MMDERGILVAPAALPIGNDWFADDPLLAQYLMQHDVVVNLSARWQRALHGWRLLDWEIDSIVHDGTDLSHAESIPPSIPVQRFVNVMFSHRCRQELEAIGPRARRIG